MIKIAKQTYDGIPVMGLKKLSKLTPPTNNGTIKFKSWLSVLRQSVLDINNPSKLTPPTNNGPIKEVVFCTVQGGRKSFPYLRLLDYINLLTDISNF